MIRMRLAALTAALALGLTGPAHAAGSTTTTTTVEQSGFFSDGQAAVAAGNWQEAIAQFSLATNDDPGDADSWNMLAYSYRKSGDLENAFANYQKALAIDPDHKDAHEYIGEAYLEVGDVAGAQKHLEALDEICWLGCSQYDELKTAIESWQAANG